MYRQEKVLYLPYGAGGLGSTFDTLQIGYDEKPQMEIDGKKLSKSKSRVLYRNVPSKKTSFSNPRFPSGGWYL